MNGAMALDCEKTISSPNDRNTSTIGTSQYFFSWRRNWKNSERTRLLLIPSSIHAEKVPAIAVAARIRRPAVGGGPPPGERVLAHQPPDETERHENHDEHQRHQHARIEVADDQRHAPPPDAWPLQERGRDRAEQDEDAADRADDLRANRPAAPEERRGDQADDGSDREPERPLGARHGGLPARR